MVFINFHKNEAASYTLAGVVINVLHLLRNEREVVSSGIIEILLVWVQVISMIFTIEHAFGVQKEVN